MGNGGQNGGGGRCPPLAAAAASAKGVSARAAAAVGLCRCRRAGCNQDTNSSWFSAGGLHSPSPYFPLLLHLGAASVALARRLLSEKRLPSISPAKKSPKLQLQQTPFPNQPTINTRDPPRHHQHGVRKRTARLRRFVSACLCPVCGVLTGC